MRQYRGKGFADPLRQIGGKQPIISSLPLAMRSKSYESGQTRFHRSVIIHNRRLIMNDRLEPGRFVGFFQCFWRFLLLFLQASPSLATIDQEVSVSITVSVIIDYQNLIIISFTNMFASYRSGCFS